MFSNFWCNIKAYLYRSAIKTKKCTCVFDGYLCSESSASFITAEQGVDSSTAHR